MRSVAGLKAVITAAARGGGAVRGGAGPKNAVRVFAAVINSPGGRGFQRADTTCSGWRRGRGRGVVAELNNSGASRARES